MKKLLLAFAAIAILSFSGSAFADHLVGPVPGSLIVVAGGLEWVYANPCPDTGCPAGNGTILDFQGWSVPTGAQIGAAFADNAAINAAFFGKCASAYFDDSSDYDHCDASWGSGSTDFDAGRIVNSPYNPGSDGFDELLLVRAVPEPASLILLGTGLAALVISRKRSA
jgi:hypothetical protein